MTFTQTLVYVNETARAVELILEPWGELYRISPGDKIEIVGRGGESGSAFEMHQTSVGLIVFGWAGSTVHIERDGQVLISNHEGL